MTMIRKTAQFFSSTKWSMTPFASVELIGQYDDVAIVEEAIEARFRDSKSFIARIVAPRAASGIEVVGEDLFGRPILAQYRPPSLPPDEVARRLRSKAVELQRKCDLKSPTAEFLFQLAHDIDGLYWHDCQNCCVSRATPTSGTS